jgi:hypothetical protein
MTCSVLALRAHDAALCQDRHRSAQLQCTYQLSKGGLLLMHKLILQTRRPREGDPGAVEYGYWIVEGDSVWLVDENGTKTGERRALNGSDPKALAINLLRSKIGKRKSDFNRPLHYPKMVY